MVLQTATADPRAAFALQNIAFAASLIDLHVFFTQETANKKLNFQIAKRLRNSGACKYNLRKKLFILMKEILGIFLDHLHLLLVSYYL